jgi:hypothetical protein
MHNDPTLAGLAVGVLCSPTIATLHLRGLYKTKSCSPWKDFYFLPTQAQKNYMLQIGNHGDLCKPDLRKKNIKVDFLKIEIRKLCFSICSGLALVHFQKIWLLRPFDLVKSNTAVLHLEAFISSISIWKTLCTTFFFSSSHVNYLVLFWAAPREDSLRTRYYKGLRLQCSVSFVKTRNGGICWITKSKNHSASKNHYGGIC